MADTTPGLAPRKLEAEVEIKGELMGQSVESTVNNQVPSVETPVEQVQVSDNTEASGKQTEGNEAQVEQPTTNRAQERIQALANEKAQAEARANQAEAMLQRLVNVQPQQPVQSESEVLAKQYKTYNPSLGYPEDPKEYATYVTTNARLAAQQESQKIATQQREQYETGELVKAYPNIVNDPIFLGAVSAQRAAAQRQGNYVTYKDAADMVSKNFESRVSKKVIADVANNDQSKDEAYVESTRGASAANRAGSTPDINSMSLEEKEAYLRKVGAW